MEETIGRRIELLINDLNITKTAFSEKLKVSQPYISKLIADKGKPSERLIDDICEKFLVNREWLLTGEGGKKNMFIKPSPANLAFNHFGYIMGNASNQKKAVLSALVEMIYHYPDDKWDYVFEQFESCLREAQKEKDTSGESSPDIAELMED